MSNMMDLAGALGGPPDGGPPSIDVQPPDDEGAEGESQGSSLDYLDAAEEALHEFIRVDPDEPDRAAAAKALQIILQLKAANQTDAEKGGMKGLRRALAGGGPVG